MLTSLNEMTEWQELGRFLVGLAGEITNNETWGLQNICKGFANQLAGLLTDISAQGVYQVVGSFEGEPTKVRDWIKSIEKYMMFAGRVIANQKGLHTRPAGVPLVITFKDIWLSTQKYAEVNESHHAFTMLHKSRQIKKESVQVYEERLYALANDEFVKVDKAVVGSQLVGFFIDGLYCDFLPLKVTRENPETFQAAV